MSEQFVEGKTYPDGTDMKAGYYYFDTIFKRSRRIFVF